MSSCRYRQMTEADFSVLQAIDLETQRRLTPDYDGLPERERSSRLSTSQTALKFYERSEHSFVADDDEVRGFVLAQSVWQGDRPVVLVRTAIVTPDASPDIVRGLLRAVVKSAYDSAVYEVHFPATPDLMPAAYAEEAHLVASYAVVHLGTRAESAPGEKLRRERDRI